MKCSLRSTVFHSIVLFISIFLCLVKHFIHKYFFTLTLYIFSTNFSMKSLFRRHSCCVVYSLDQGSQILIFLRKTSVFRHEPHVFQFYLITHILPHVLEKNSWLPHDLRISFKTTLLTMYCLKIYILFQNIQQTRYILEFFFCYYWWLAFVVMVTAIH